MLDLSLCPTLMKNHSNIVMIVIAGDEVQYTYYQYPHFMDKFYIVANEWLKFAHSNTNVVSQSMSIYT